MTIVSEVFRFWLALAPVVHLFSRAGNRLLDVYSSKTVCFRGLGARRLILPIAAIDETLLPST